MLRLLLTWVDRPLYVLGSGSESSNSPKVLQLSAIPTTVAPSPAVIALPMEDWRHLVFAVLALSESLPCPLPLKGNGGPLPFQQGNGGPLPLPYLPLP